MTEPASPPTNSTMLAAFEVGLAYGCLVVRDTDSDGDVSDWGPRQVNWHVDGSSAIFGMIPSVEGLARCEVWNSRPPEPLPASLFTTEFVIDGAFQVEDPDRVFVLELRSLRGRRRIEVLVDDLELPTRAQVIVELV